MSTLLTAVSLVLFLLGICFSGANRPAAPVNISVNHLRAHSAMVSWNVLEGEAVIGFAISQQRQDGLTQRFIREVNTTSRACVLWDLNENTDYIIQVQSIGLHGESQASKRVHFRTLEKADHFQSIMAQGDPSVEGLDISRRLQTGEMLIIMTVLLLWAAVIALFCRQYDIIKDNDSNNHSKDKTKPLSVYSTPDYHSGSLTGSKRTVSSVSIIKV
ncbi:fibronectin type III domain-containing protein 4 isoform X3 [Electrophorus electricus]|uniref:fibronectin type III domain-containing protein 4 isoform X3 n=1 Tax=Electrophorus electricus TaxID=8005 RepID=UPI0015D0226F|nr:fibronectin type III domain-containing protein 4 isoform X3 [Electrophorus electricus]